MIGFEDRLKKERPIIEKFVSEYQIQAALDAGCGTGFNSIVLAQLGVQVTATDISEHMLHRAKNNAERKGVHIDTRRCSFEDVAALAHRMYDAVFCLGNSLAHLTTKKDLKKSLKSFKYVLRPGGTLVLQLLNYTRILHDQERIVHIKEVQGKTFIRFYDFMDERLIFNILTLQKEGNSIRHNLHSIHLHPWQSEEIIHSLHSSGYKDIQRYGSMALEPYHKNTSKDLIIVAH